MLARMQLELTKICHTAQGNYSHYLVITFNGVKSVKVSNHYAAYLKLI